MISVVSYFVSLFEYRSKINVCEEIMKEKAEIKSQNLEPVKLCKKQILN